MAGVRKRRESGFRVREKREALQRAKIPFPFPGFRTPGTQTRWSGAHVLV